MQKTKPKDYRKVSADSPIRPRPCAEASCERPKAPRPAEALSPRPSRRGPLIETLSPRPRPERPRTGCQFSDSLEAGLGKQPRYLRPDRTPLTKRHVRINVPNYSRKTSAARGYSAGRATDGTGDRAQQGLPATVLITVLPTDTRTALCYLTPAPRTKRHGRSGPGPCSLSNSRRVQLLVLRLV